MKAPRGVVKALIKVFVLPLRAVGVVIVKNPSGCEDCESSGLIQNADKMMKLMVETGVKD